MPQRTEIVEAIVAAWRAHDIDTVMSHVTDDIDWHFHVGSRPVRGAKAMRSVLSKLAAYQLDVRWRLVRSAETSDAVLVEGTDDFHTPDGTHVQVPYMGVFEFAGDKVSAWRDYVDLDVMTRAGAGEALADWLTPLVERPGRPG